MKHIARIFGMVLIATAAAAADASAQWNVARFESGRNRIYGSAGVDPALVTTLGYGRVFTIFGRDVQATADVGVAGARAETGDFRARLGVQSSVLRWRAVQLTGTATFITRGTENTVYRGINFGADITGAVGVYRPGWFAAGEFGKDKAIITHVTHTDWYRDNHYSDAKDGWYLDAGGRYHYGAAAGLTLGSAELVGRAGWNRTEDFKDLPFPIYATLSLGFGF